MRPFGNVTPQIVEELRSILGERQVIVDPEILGNYSADSAGACWGHLPEAVVRPGSTEEVSAVMKMASRYNLAVTPQGARSGVSGGAVPVCGGIVLSLERMNRILEIDDLNRVAVVEPGVVTNDLCKAVAERGFLYAGYPMSTGTSFIGGNLATNAGGGKVIRYGSTRRHILGAEVVLASGEVLQLGGKFRKDCWGYNLLSLMIGSEGTLGIATKIIVNLEPKPGKIANLLACFPTLESMVEAASALVSSGKKIISCEFTDKFTTKVTTDYLGTTLPEQDRTEAYLLIQVEGETEDQLEDGFITVGKLCEARGAFEVFVAESRSESAAMWSVRENILEAMKNYAPDVCASGDIVVPLSAIPEMIRRIQRLAAEWEVPTAIIAHIGDGNIHPMPLRPQGMEPQQWPQFSERYIEALIAEATKLGGVGSGEHGVGYVKQHALIASKSPAELAILKGIKDAFDPQGILNPGKLTFLEKKEG